MAEIVGVIGRGMRLPKAAQPRNEQTGGTRLLSICDRTESTSTPEWALLVIVDGFPLSSLFTECCYLV
jgi:hypothetical protein